MSIRFAAPPHTLACRMAPLQAHAFGHVAANDNGESSNQAAIDAALRHFARHGMAAAHRARRQAEKAFVAGDRDGFGRWLDICRTLDRRMALELRRDPAPSR